MVDEKPIGAVNQSNGEPNKGVIETFPGGKQSTLPAEPQLPEALTAPAMGCTTSHEDDSTAMSIDEQTSNDKQTTIDKYFSPVEKKGDNIPKNNNNQSPKRPNVNDDDDDALENKSNKRQFSASTRSSKFLPKLRDTFDDSDDDDDSANSRYKSWAKQDINEYRNNYPNARQDTRIKDNYQFYTNQISSHPDGDYIDNIHKEWFGKYRHLEYHHGYIQWLFPLQEKGLNWSAEPLQKHEIELIKKDKKALKRILKSYELMLDFYGFELVDDKTGELRRLRKDAYKERFRNLNTSSHNYLRITRILKCLGEFDYEYLKFPFLEAILRECITEDTLGNCLRSCKDYWIETLRSKEERRAIRRYAKDLIEYRNKEMQPPKSHRAERPAATSTTKAQKMSTSNEQGTHSD